MAYLDEDILYNNIEEKYKVAKGSAREAYSDVLDTICEMPRADVVPKSEVETLNKQLDELAEEHSDLIVEKDKLFDIAEKQKVEIEALKIANEKMYIANQEQRAENEHLTAEVAGLKRFIKDLMKDEGKT